MDYSNKWNTVGSVAMSWVNAVGIVAVGANTAYGLIAISGNGRATSLLQVS